MRLLFFCAIIGAALFSMSAKAKNIDNTKDLFILKCGDYEAAFSEGCKYTISWLKWKGYSVIENSGGYSGTVLCYPPRGKVGCGHKEGGLEEDVKSIEFSSDGQVFTPEKGKTYTGSVFVIKKTALLGNLQLNSELTITPAEIKDTRGFEAIGDQSITNLYIFMYCFSPKSSQWIAECQDGKKLEGTFSTSNKSLMTSDIKWAAQFNESEGVCVGLSYPEPIIGKQKKSNFLDAAKYRKFYLFLNVPEKVSAGFTVPPKTVIVRNFNATAENWKETAEKVLSK